MIKREKLLFDTRQGIYTYILLIFSRGLVKDLKRRKTLGKDEKRNKGLLRYLYIKEKAKKKKVITSNWRSI